MLASCWSYLQSFYRHIASRIVITATVNDCQADAVLYYLK
jgi:hypothetical protein